MDIFLDFQSQPIMETSRLHLRALVISDAGKVADGLNDFDVAKMLVRVPWPHTLEGAIWWINQWLEGHQNGWCFVICEQERPDDLIGVVSVEPGTDSYVMGWWLIKAHWNKGYMTEAVDAVVQYVSQARPQVSLTAGAIADNPASLRIQEKLGFEVTGREDVLCVSRNAVVEVVKTRFAVK